MEEKVKMVEAYTHSFDQRDYRNLSLAPEPKTEKRKALDSYTTRQVETLIGERFNVLLSTTRYEIKNGMIYGENMNEPFMDVLVRGRNHRRLVGNKVDREREDAEVVGFGNVESGGDGKGGLVSPDIPIGTTYLSISEKGEEGSSYQHNFYDFFIKKQDEKGIYIEARRYSSSLSHEEYVGLAKSFGVNVPENSDAAFFLSHPIAIDTSRFKTPDDLHKFMHREHDYILEEEYKEIIKACAPLIISYINALASDNLEWQKIAFNAILNRADDKWMEIRRGEVNLFEKDLGEEEIRALGMRMVREVTTGCGASVGFNMTNGGLMPYSVSEFGRKADGTEVCSCGASKEDNHYHCPDCQKWYADETLKAPGERTKQCGCGFKFPCSDEKPLLN